MSKIPKTFNQVKSLIEKFPLLADDDSRLVVNQWINEITSAGLNINTMSATDLLTMIKNEELSAFDSISRARRLVEELHPTLRGKSYNDRQKHKQDEAKSDIKNLKENYEKQPTGNDLLAAKYQKKVNTQQLPFNG